MNTYMVSVALQVEVQAFSQDDAFEVIDDCFGGEACGLTVVDYEILDHAEL